MELQPCLVCGLDSLLAEEGRKSPSFVGIHYILHCRTLASRTLPTGVRNFLNVAIEIVNRVKDCIFKLFCTDMESERGTWFFHVNV